MWWFLFPHLNKTRLKLKETPTVRLAKQITWIAFIIFSICILGWSVFGRLPSITQNPCFSPAPSPNYWEKKNSRKIILGAHTSVAHPLFAECVHGADPPPQLVHATISFGPPASRFLSPWMCPSKPKNTIATTTTKMCETKITRYCILIDKISKMPFRLNFGRNKYYIKVNKKTTNGCDQQMKNVHTARDWNRNGTFKLYVHLPADDYPIEMRKSTKKLSKYWDD